MDLQNNSFADHSGLLQKLAVLSIRAGLAAFVGGTPEEVCALDLWNSDAFC